MRWPWTRHKQANRQDRATAGAGLAAAQERLDEAHAKESAVLELVRRLHAARDRNNFAASIEAAFREHR